MPWPRFSSLLPSSKPTQWLSRLNVLLSLILASAQPLSAQTACVGDASVSAPLPLSTIDYLRSYQAFFNSPSRLALDPAHPGRLYITDPLNSRVIARDEDGRILFEITDLGYPTSVASGLDGRIYIGDPAARRVDIYTAAGVLEGSLGQGNGEFEDPTDIAVHPESGDIYVSDARAHSIKRYDADGVFIASYGSLGTGEAQFRFPTGIFVSADEIFVSDQRNSRLQVFDTEGIFKFCINSKTPAPCPGGLSLVPCGGNRQFDQGLWVDEAGRIFIADAFEGKIWVIARNGALLSAIGGFGPGPGELRSPTDIIIDSHGRLFVASSGNARVNIFGLDSYGDPEDYAPGQLDISTDPLELPGTQEIVAHLELPGYPLAQVDISLIRANDIAAPISSQRGDFDQDTTPDIRLVFGADLIAALPAQGEATITLSGVVEDLLFELSDTIQIVQINPDADGDGIFDETDNCPATSNPDQDDQDSDGIGDACDIDIDGDGVANDDDNCPLIINPAQDDTDGDDMGDTCDPDKDNDSILNDADNCPLVANVDQTDIDRDGAGDACDGDLDGDGIDNANDNCPLVANSGQSDLDGDGMGDACDADIDGDGVLNDSDQCAATPSDELVSPEHGCSINQLCSCEGPRGTTERWKNRGKYVSCVAHSAEDFLQQGLISEAEKDQIVSAAAQSQCGS